jgi:hypothetical protein
MFFFKKKQFNKKTSGNSILTLKMAENAVLIHQNNIIAACSTHHSGPRSSLSYRESNKAWLQSTKEAHLIGLKKTFHSLKTLAAIISYNPSIS